MQKRNQLLLAAVLAPLLVQTAHAEGDSPWLPIPGQFALTLNASQQSGKSAYIGGALTPISAITGGGASTYKRSTTTLRADYGLSDSVALDASFGQARVRVGAADNDDGPTDSTLGLRWRVLDEYEDPALPTLTLRAAAIVKGSYNGARLAAVGKGGSGFEAAVVLGKTIGNNVSIWGELGVQDRDHGVPNTTFIDIGARWRFTRGWSASLGWSQRKFGGALDIGGTGFSPARFQQVREERSVVKFGLAWAVAGNQTLALNSAKTTSGRNTVKDDNALGLAYTVAF